MKGSEAFGQPIISILSDHVVFAGIAAIAEMHTNRLYTFSLDDEDK